MWPLTIIRRLRAYWNDPRVHIVAQHWPFGIFFMVHLCRYSEHEAERIISIVQSPPQDTLWVDPYDTDPEYADLIKKVDAMIAETIPLRRGACYRSWDVKKATLRKHGLLWLSPRDLNPHMRFD